jgi:hypothetical protein
MVAWRRRLADCLSKEIALLFDEGQSHELGCSLVEGAFYHCHHTHPNKKGKQEHPLFLSAWFSFCSLAVTCGLL